MRPIALLRRQCDWSRRKARCRESALAAFRTWPPDLL